MLYDLNFFYSSTLKSTKVSSGSQGEGWKEWLFRKGVRQDQELQFREAVDTVGYAGYSRGQPAYCILRQ